MTLQRLYDAVRDAYLNAEGRDGYRRAEGAHLLAAKESAVALYCPRHGGAHPLTVREVEELIYGLVGDLADTQSEEDLIGDTPDSYVSSWCPLDALRTYGDAEMYAEHIDGSIEARLRAGVIVRPDGEIV